MSRSKIRAASLLLLATAPFSAVLAADGSVTVQPVTSALGARAGAPALKPAPAETVPAPVVYETRATRRPDGSVALECLEAPNPQYADRAQRSTLHLHEQER